MGLVYIKKDSSFFYVSVAALLQSAPHVAPAIRPLPSAEWPSEPPRPPGDAAVALDSPVKEEAFKNYTLVAK